VIVFVYGTLTDETTVAEVLEDWSFAGEAVLDGLHRVDGEYPTLGPGGRVDGRLLRTPEVDRLDAYEGVGRGLYVRVEVPVAPGQSDAVAVYVGDPDRLGVDVEWPGDAALADRVRDYVDAADVVVRRDRQR